MDRGLNQGKARGSLAKSTSADRFVVWLTSAQSNLSRRMPIRWFRTQGEAAVVRVAGAGLRGGGLAGAREIR